MCSAVSCGACVSVECAVERAARKDLRDLPPLESRLGPARGGGQAWQHRKFLPC